MLITMYKNNKTGSFAETQLTENYVPMAEDELEWFEKYGSEGFILTDKGFNINPDYEAEQAEERQKQFEKEFFLTSIGYIRRKATMANGEIKDFLTDLLPSIKGGIEVGLPPTIITYDKPDFTKDITDLSIYQKPKIATMDFVKECFMQLSNDFLPVKEEPEEPEIEPDLEPKDDVDNSETDIDNLENIKQLTEFEKQAGKLREELQELKKEGESDEND